jgi:hypothetical protein
LFNGDPHPGNYFFADDGSIWFLDFGMVKRFSDADVGNLRDRISALRSGDPEAIVEIMRRHRWLSTDAPVDVARAAELATVMNLPLLERRPFVHTREHHARVVDSVLNIRGPYAEVHRHLTVPRDQLILTRIQIGLGALLARLGATADWASIVDEYLFDGPPSTLMGEQVAAWPRPAYAA